MSTRGQDKTIHDRIDYIVVGKVGDKQSYHDYVWPVCLRDDHHAAKQIVSVCNKQALYFHDHFVAVKRLTSVQEAEMASYRKQMFDPFFRVGRHPSVYEVWTVYEDPTSFGIGPVLPPELEHGITANQTACDHLGDVPGNAFFPCAGRHGHRGPHRPLCENGACCAIARIAVATGRNEMLLNAVVDRFCENDTCGQLLLDYWPAVYCSDECALDDSR